MAINHYQLLGIPEDADARRIKAAYRSMAKRFHPDANKGSEAAADLFRKLNEAYRILSDEKLRAAYNKTIVTAKPRQSSRDETAAKPKVDPQQKFNRFLNSLLDAIFEAPDLPAEEPVRKAPAKKAAPARKPKRRPDFNFYYYLAMEQGKNTYRCDEDGIYRRNKDDRPRRPGPIPGTALLIFLISGLWEIMKQ